jgi:hypothetical protein
MENKGDSWFWQDKSGKPAMNLSGIVVQPQPLTIYYPSGSIEANEQVEILSEVSRNQH